MMCKQHTSVGSPLTWTPLSPRPGYCGHARWICGPHFAARNSCMCTSCTPLFVEMVHVLLRQARRLLDTVHNCTFTLISAGYWLASIFLKCVLDVLSSNIIFVSIHVFLQMLRVVSEIVECLPLYSNTKKLASSWHKYHVAAIKDADDGAHILAVFRLRWFFLVLIVGSLGWVSEDGSRRAWKYVGVIILNCTKRKMKNIHWSFTALNGRCLGIRA
jgi:hypothetical protein